MLKIYFDDLHYNKKFREHLFPLLKPFVKPEPFSDQKRLEVYGVSNQDFNIVSVIQEADIFVLTMSWNYYVESGKTEDALKFINKAAKLDKEIWIVSLGDISYKLPPYNHIKVFRASGFKTKLPNTHVGLPVFKKDPLKVIYQTTHIELPEYTLKPKIGFCGFANGSYFDAFKEVIRALVKTTINVFKTNPYEPNPLYIASFERYKLLKHLQKEKNITTNFIFRKYYRAGVNSLEQRKQTMLEYFNNTKESQYKEDINNAMDLFPYFRQIITYTWKETKHLKGYTRFKYFMANSISNCIHFKVVSE